MIIAIRISGLVEVPSAVKEKLYRLRLRRKYSAVLLKDTKENADLLRQVRDFIAYGIISQEEANELIKKRGEDNKPFFRLHPPRGGIDSKIHFPIKKGVLGDHGDKINLLLKRML